MITSERDSEARGTAGNNGSQWSWQINTPECPHFQKLVWITGAVKCDVKMSLTNNIGHVQVTGSRIANNQVVTPTSLTSLSAYVQQDDLFIGTLTVREHLTFQSLVRMDKHVRRGERRERIDQVIEQVK